MICDYGDPRLEISISLLENLVAILIWLMHFCEVTNFHSLSNIFVMTTKNLYMCTILLYYFLIYFEDELVFEYETVKAIVL